MITSRTYVRIHSTTLYPPTYFPFPKVLYNVPGLVRWHVLFLDLSVLAYHLELVVTNNAYQQLLLVINSYNLIFRYRKDLLVAVSTTLTKNLSPTINSSLLAYHLQLLVAYHLQLLVTYLITKTGCLQQLLVDYLLQQLVDCLLQL